MTLAPHEVEAWIPVPGAELAGSLMLPEGSRSKSPAVLLLGGTFSDLRNGDPDPRKRPDVPEHRMYWHLATDLAQRGIASLRFDRRGCGESTGSYEEGRQREISDALAAWDWLLDRPEIMKPVGMVGESAGAYVLCHLARLGARPSAAVLQGALHRDIEGLIRYNVDNARTYMESGSEARAWLRDHAPRTYADVELADVLYNAIEARADTAESDGDGERLKRNLADLRFDLDNPPADQFQYLKCPTLVIHGAEDLNVPVEDTFATVTSLWAAGNRDVELRIIPDADHSFQQPAPDYETRMRERFSLHSFARPFHPSYPRAIGEWLETQLFPEDELQDQTTTEGTST